MCLIIKEKFKSAMVALEYSEKPKIATEDIKVFKVLNNDRRMNCIGSPFQYEQYSKGELKTSEKFTFSGTQFGDECELGVEQGLHSYKKLNFAPRSVLLMLESYFIIQCTIPKGTPYFENEDEYVSLALQMPEEFNSIEGSKVLY